MAAPSAKAAATATAAASSRGLSASGIAFFGSLCAGTFGLGCWQTKRYFEKVDMVAKREEELSMPPVTLGPTVRCTVEEQAGSASSSSTTMENPKEPTASQWIQQRHRRVLVSGTYKHVDEILVGPRGPPPGAIAETGPKSGRSSGGMSSSPQGYFVITPLTLKDGNGTVLVNRGWVPLQYAKQGLSWNRPSGVVDVVGVSSQAEKPRFLSPEHDKKDPKKLLWMDRAAMEERTRTSGLSPLLLVETSKENSGAESSDGVQDEPHLSFPVKPRVDTVGEFKVTPMIHVGYAVTWFGLSGAGMIMTRKLLTRGRG